MSDWRMFAWQRLKALRRGRPRAEMRVRGTRRARDHTGQVLSALTGVWGVRPAREPVVATICGYRGAAKSSSPKTPRHAGDPPDDNTTSTSGLPRPQALRSRDHASTGHHPGPPPLPFRPTSRLSPRASGHRHGVSCRHGRGETWKLSECSLRARAAATTWRPRVQKALHMWSSRSVSERNST